MVGNSPNLELGVAVDIDPRFSLYAVGVQFDTKRRGRYYFFLDESKCISEFYCKS